MDMDNTDPGRKERHEPVGRDKSRRKERRTGGVERREGKWEDWKTGRRGEEETKGRQEDEVSRG